VSVSHSARRSQRRRPLIALWAHVSSACEVAGGGHLVAKSLEMGSEGWRRRPDLNRGWRFCRPLPYHLATAPIGCERDAGRPTHPREALRDTGSPAKENGAGNGIRTRDFDLGKVALYH
jgi:hypothetical protein